MKRMIWSGLMLSATLLVACSDDLGNGQRYDDGQLHLKFTFNDAASKWNEGAEPSTRAMAPIKMSTDGMDGLTLYLHCEEEEMIETRIADMPETRGKRLTGEAFQDESLTSFGLYAKVGNTVVLPYSTKLSKSGFTYDGSEWFEKDNVELDFGASSDGWPTGDEGNFYAWAPFTTDADNITSVGDNDGVPTLTYTMQREEAKNKDILTAQCLNLSHTDKNNKGVELKFRHVLSAVKFKGSIFNGFKATVNNEEISFTLKVKEILIEGIKNTGTLPLNNSNTTWTLGNTTDYCKVTDINTSSTEDCINTDEHCFMLLPQAIDANDANAHLKFLCDVYAENNPTPIREGLAIQASLAGLTWLPGHSYTYTINDTELVRRIVFTPSNPTFPATGGVREFTVKSYLTTGTETDGLSATWHPEYLDGEEWKTGVPDGYILLDSEGNPLLDEELNELPGAKLDEDGNLVGIKYKLEAVRRSELSSTIPALQNHTPYGTKTNYHDLSLHDVTGATLPNGRSTANCYIINGPGYFKFPLVYGNAIKNGKVNTLSYTEQETTLTSNNTIFVNYHDEHITTPNIIDDVANDPNSKVTTWEDVEPFILWQDESNLVLPDNLELVKEGDLYFLKFQISKAYIATGNVILGIREKFKQDEIVALQGTKTKEIKNNQRILWTWHIWVTKENFNQTVNVSKTISGTPRSLDFTHWNLGWRIPETFHYDTKDTNFQLKQNNSNYTTPITATQNEGDVTISGSNLYYQHGRKDPQPAAYIENEEVVDMTVKIAHKLGYCTNYWTPDNVDNPTKYDITAKGGVTMGAAIQHPYYLYAANAGDWMAPNASVVKAGRWDPEKAGTGAGNTGRNDPSAYSHIKTIYDPCPYGFAVPPRSAYYLLGQWASPSSATTRDGMYGREFKVGSDNLFFYYTGWRTHDYGYIEQFTGKNTDDGYCWTAGVNGQNGCQLHIYGNNSVEYEFFYCRNHTEPVRAVRDNEEERISVLYNIHVGEGTVRPEDSFSRRK